MRRAVVKLWKIVETTYVFCNRNERDGYSVQIRLKKSVLSHGVIAWGVGIEQFGVRVVVVLCCGWQG
jgi:hypothetical protein